MTAVRVAVRPHLVSRHGSREKAVALPSSKKEIHPPAQTVGNMANGLLSMYSGALRAGHNELSGVPQCLRPEVSSMQELSLYILTVSRPDMAIFQVKRCIENEYDGPCRI